MNTCRHPTYSYAFADFFKRTALVLLLFAPFTFLAGQPVIHSFSPASGPAGTQVVITGSNFSAVPADNIVYFGTVRAIVAAATPASVTVTVPGGASYQLLSITVSNLTAYSTKPFIVTFPGGGMIFPNSLIDYTIYNTTSYARSVVAADFDGDGKPDIIAANGENSNGNASENTVSFFRNTSTGGSISFAPKMDSLIGPYLSGPAQVCTGDIDGDGKPDPVVVNSSGKIAVLRNTGTPGSMSFERYVNFNTGADPRSLALLDADGDGRPDVGVANNFDNTISVLRNTGSPGVVSFASRVNYVADRPVYIASGDIDGDGRPDLVTANGYANTISVYKNNSTAGVISFAAKVDFTTPSFPNGLAIGDIDGDGNPEIIVSNSNGNSVSVFRNTSISGTISLAARLDFATENSASNVFITDVDGDGKPDVTVANAGTNKLSLLKNTSSAGTITFATRIDYSLGTANHPRSLFLCDFNADGKPDIAVGHSDRAFATVVRNRVAEPTIASFTPQTATSGTTITITGTNFTPATSVSFGGTQAASFTIVSPTTITAIVGAGTSGDVKVTTPYGVASLAGFNYTALPVITSFTPAAAGNGAPVTITGNYFLGTTAVSFGGVPAVSFTVVSPTSIQAVVGTGASGTVLVTTPVGTASLAGFTYTVPPVITSFSPVSGPVGSTVTITGNNFSATAANNIVYFGAVKATVNTANATTLTVTVPPGATYQPVSVTTNYYTAYTDKPFRVTFPDAAAPFSANFLAPRIDSAAKEQPEGVACADFDNDGKADVALVNGQSIVSVFRNTGMPGTISFAAVQDFPAGSFPNSVFAADINSDGKQDLVLSSTGIAILINTSGPGAISFAAPYNLTAGALVYYTVVGDIDKDGRPDIVTSYSGGNAVTVYRNLSHNGVVSFVRASSFIAGEDLPRVAIGDLNGDGRPEIVVSDNLDNFISVLRNTSSPGSVSFASRVNYPAGDGPYRVFLADFNNDGLADIAAGNYFDGTLSVYRNTGTGSALSFAAKVDFATGQGPHDITVSDLNGDGKPDIITANRDDSTISLLKNTSSGAVISFDSRADYRTGFEPVTVREGDLDADGVPDLIVSNNSSETVSFFRNQHNRPVITAITPDKGVVGTTVTITGYNFGGTTAVRFGGTPAASYSIVSSNTITAVTGEGSNGAVSVTSAGGTAFFEAFSFTPPVITAVTPLAASQGALVLITGTNFSAVAPNNIVYFGATRATVAAATTTLLTVTVPAGANYQFVTVTTHNLTAYSPKPFILTFNSGGAGFTSASFADKVDLLTGGSSRGVVIKDFDGDGKPDLAAPDYDHHTVAVFRNTSSPGIVSFAARAVFSTDNNAWFVDAGDMDGDGRPDLVVANNTGSVSVLRNISVPGTISFAPKMNMNVGTDTRYVSIGDLDSDGKPDIAIANGFGEFVVYRNNSTVGNISLTGKKVIHISNLPVALAIGDLNGDDKPDLVTSNNTNMNVIVFRNASTPGNISFVQATSVSISGFPWGVAIGDLNEDGKPDVAVTVEGLLGGAVVSVMRNTGSGSAISFATAGSYQLEGTGYGVAIGDLNGDSKPDLAVTDTRGQAYVSVFRNTTIAGSILFSPRINYTTGYGPYHVQTGDIDGDGKTDLVTANSNGSSVSVLLNKLTVITAVPDVPAEELKVTVSPNPFAGFIDVKTGRTLTNVLLELMDLQAHILYTDFRRIIQAGSSIRIETPSLSAGTYFLRITTSEGRSVVKLIRL